MEPSDMSQSEAERQVIAAFDRYREAVASMDAGGRPEAGQRAAVKAVGRALQLVSFVLARAADGGVPVERLGELIGWDPALVREAIQRPPEPALVRRVAPAGVDSAGVARAAASFAAAERLRTLTQDILAVGGDERRSPAAADVEQLHDRLERAWRGWRAEHSGPME
jgi:hypothetical protein